MSVKHRIRITEVLRILTFAVDGSRKSFLLFYCVIQIISIIGYTLYDRIIDLGIRNPDPCVDIRILLLQFLKVDRDIRFCNFRILSNFRRRLRNITFFFRFFALLLCKFDVDIFVLFFFPQVQETERHRTDKYYKKKQKEKLAFFIQLRSPSFFLLL